MLQPHHFTFKCPLKLSDLDQSNGGYYCNQCRKDIHDLTDCSLDEIRDLQRRKGAICGFIRVVGVSSMMGLAACSKPGSDGKDPGKEAKNSKPIEEQPILMGDVCVPKEEAPPAVPEGQVPVETPPVQAEPEEPQAPNAEVPPAQPVPPVMMGMICPPEHLNAPPPPEVPLNPPT
jgi:hypothetical protein